MGKKILVAMSGGVDSSVAASLLKEKGYEVSGVTLCFGVKVDEEKVKCCGPQAIEDAKRVAHSLGIPHYVMDFSKELEEKVINKFVSEYLKGRTPNPCIDCNRFLKFGILLEKALIMGFDFLATGHYARIEENKESFILKKAKDKVKDQSYFLYPIRREMLKFIIFPLGELTKEQVREIAKERNLPIFNKPQSQDLCFIPERDYRKFILQRINYVEPGEIVDMEGNVLGKHKGLFHYTIGQREGIGISNKYPLYVLAKDIEKNQLKVGPKKYLKVSGLIASDLNILVDNLPQEAYALIRYRHKGRRCNIFKEGEKVKVIFEGKEEAVTPGQSVVFYDEDIVLGGGIIEEVIP